MLFLENCLAQVSAPEDQELCSQKDLWADVNSSIPHENQRQIHSDTHHLNGRQSVVYLSMIMPKQSTGAWYHTDKP